MADVKEPSPDQARFRCLRCSEEFMLPYTPGKLVERTCPSCESNSVRRLKSQAAEPEPPAAT